MSGIRNPVVTVIGDCHAVNFFTVPSKTGLTSIYVILCDNVESLL
jgi:hypothetical protein